MTRLVLFLSNGQVGALEQWRPIEVHHKPRYRFIAHAESIERQVAVAPGIDADQPHQHPWRNRGPADPLPGEQVDADHRSTVPRRARPTAVAIAGATCLRCSAGSTRSATSHFANGSPTTVSTPSSSDRKRSKFASRAVPPLSTTRPTRLSRQRVWK